MLDMTGRLAVVVGGGAVGRRKVRSLLQAGAVVRVVDPVGRSIRGATLVRRRYRGGDVKGAALVFACTGDRQLNARIAAHARRAGALVNAVDQTEDCDFLAPAVVRQREVTVAIGTGGTAPALTKMLKTRLTAALPPRIGEFAAALETLRGLLRRKLPASPRRQEIMKQLTGESGYGIFLACGAKALRRHCLKLLKKAQ